MYVISRSPSLTMPLRDTKTDYHPSTGAVLKVHPALSVQFHHSGGAPDWAKDAVQKLPGFGNGMGHNEDPFSRVGVLDTDEEAIRQHWSPEEKAYVEKALRDAPSSGIEYVICAAPAAVRPWDKYDDFDGDDAVAKIVYTIDLIGVDPKVVLRYERENLGRPDVLAAVEDLLERDAEEVVVVISA